MSALVCTVEAEVDAQIVLREVASSAAYLVDLGEGLAVSGWLRCDGDARAYAAAIGFGADGANLDPVAAGG